MDNNQIILPESYRYIQALNECLNNYSDEHAERFLKLWQVTFSFDLKQFWFCITGVPKRVFLDIYGITPQEYFSIYSAIREQLQKIICSQGWEADIFF